MNKTFKIKALKALILSGLSLSWNSSVLAEVSEDSYSDQDRHKAIIMCMTVQYVQLYQEHPAEEDAMTTCNARYQRLMQEIPYAHYKQWLLDTPYSPYPSPETSALLDQYHRIMLGLDEATLLIN
ncbi:hypothetical protein [Oligella urethralis]|uniref:hypothetical protein n=1 Tax=Oligella urethralis TaxID=90245 RepID=UPI000660114A|nr:hypothetical protein [Oligella urethralis]